MISVIEIYCRTKEALKASLKKAKTLESEGKIQLVGYGKYIDEPGYFFTIMEKNDERHYNQFWDNQRHGREMAKGKHFDIVAELSLAVSKRT